MTKILCAALLLPCLAAAGTSAWIADPLEVPLRAGGGSQAKAIKSLPSGTAVTVLDGGETNGYRHVKLGSGEEGWVAARYLSVTPVAIGDHEESAKALAALREENQRLKAGLEAAEKSSQALGTENARLASEVAAIRQASANVLQIQNERDQLTLEKVSLESELETLRRENQALDASGRQDWFMIGAGVLFGGIVLGLVLPRLGWRKKSSWESF